MEHSAVTNFREYLRIKSLPPDADYDGCVKFLQKMASELQLPIQVIEVHPGYPVVVISWEGTNPSLGSILLNSHMDVVPVYPSEWKYDPFAAVKTDNGDIYARGSQDMKCVGIQYIEAIRKLKGEGKRFSRTIHLSFVPDEERGGHLGLELFIRRGEFKKLNVDFALDEGLANPTDEFVVYNGERPIWEVKVKCTGTPGHGSRFVPNTAAEKLRKVINKFLEFRDSEEKRMIENNLKLGDVTTVNMNMINGGIQMNVVPSEITACFDIRVCLNVDFKEFQERIISWANAAGDGVTFTFLSQHLDKTITSIDENDKWWKAFSSASKSMNVKLINEIFPAATDSRYLRQIGIPALGFSPMNNTPILLHDHNEYLNEKIFLRGIDIYAGIIPALASVE